MCAETQRVAAQFAIRPSRRSCGLRDKNRHLLEIRSICRFKNCIIKRTIGQGGEKEMNSLSPTEKYSGFILLTTTRTSQIFQPCRIHFSEEKKKKKQQHTFIPVFTTLCKTLSARNRCFAEASRIFEKYADAREFHGRREAAGGRR